MRYVDTLRQIAQTFETLSTFVATQTVQNERLFGDRIFCLKGDTIVVERWHCRMGPTSVTVNHRPFCVPFEWLVEAGAPARLKDYMPFAPKTWAQVITEMEENPMFRVEKVEQ